MTDATKTVNLLEDEAEARRLLDLLYEFDLPPDDEHVELTDHSGISMV
jgi:hypothetical protein